MTRAAPNRAAQERACGFKTRQRPASKAALLGNSLMVEQRTLTPLVLVRIQVPQPLDIIEFSIIHVALSVAPMVSVLMRFQPSTSVSGVRALSKRCFEFGFAKPLLTIVDGVVVGCGGAQILGNIAARIVG